MKIKNWNKQLFSRLLNKASILLNSSQSTKCFWSLGLNKRISIHSFIPGILLLIISNSLYAEQLSPSPNRINVSQVEESSHAGLKGEDASEQSKEEQRQPIPIKVTENLGNQKQSNNPDNLSNQDNRWLFLHSYEAKYAVQSGRDTLGHATRKLSQKDGSWILSTNAKIKKYLLSVRNTETTDFRINDNALVTDRFYSKTKITFKKARVMEQNFDWENMMETGKRKDKTWKIPLEKPVFDRVSHIVQMRADLLAGNKSFDYNVSYKGKLHVYSYSEEKMEVLQTKMGPLAGIKFVRQKSNGDIFSLWLCPELNYIPIKIAQYEQDKADVTLVLESVKYQSD